MIKVAVTLAVLAVVAIGISGPGTRGRWWHFRIGIALFAFSGLLGAAAVVTGALAWRQGSILGAAAAIAGAIVILGPLSGAIAARGKPMIHDITTDLDDPPRFHVLHVAPFEARVGEIQRKAYPDVKPRTLETSPADAFARARTAAESLGWEIASARPDEGTLEATDTTGWFGFKDDIVVRIRPAGSGSRIDVRSTSRVGKSDVGMNAKRIREYLGKV
jgi:uncharacterized protein (DUF1499 family)